MKNEVYDLIENGFKSITDMKQYMNEIYDMCQEICYTYRDKCFTDNICDLLESGLRIRNEYVPELTYSDCFVPFIWFDTNADHERIMAYCGNAEYKPLSDFIDNGEIIYIFESIVNELDARGL